MKKYENFCKALGNLQDINNYSAPYDNVATVGLVGLYSICFEQSWKAMKEILEEQGYLQEKLGSPRMVLKVAYQAGMLSDEQLWLDALASRNNVAHSYNQAIANKIIEDTKQKYLTMFVALQVEIEKNWL